MLETTSESELRFRGKGAPQVHGSTSAQNEDVSSVEVHYDTLTIEKDAHEPPKHGEEDAPVEPCIPKAATHDLKCLGSQFGTGAESRNGSLSMDDDIRDEQKRV